MKKLVISLILVPTCILLAVFGYWQAIVAVIFPAFAICYVVDMCLTGTWAKFIDADLRRRKESLVHTNEGYYSPGGVNDRVAEILGAHPDMLRMHENGILPGYLLSLFEIITHRPKSIKKFHSALVKIGIVQRNELAKSVIYLSKLSQTGIPITAGSGYDVIVNKCSNEKAGGWYLQRYSN